MKRRYDSEVHSPGAVVSSSTFSLLTSLFSSDSLISKMASIHAISASFVLENSMELINESSNLTYSWHEDTEKFLKITFVLFVKQYRVDKSYESKISRPGWRFVPGFHFHKTNFTHITICCRSDYIIQLIALAIGPHKVGMKHNIHGFIDGSCLPVKPRVLVFIPTLPRHVYCAWLYKPYEFLGFV